MTDEVNQEIIQSTQKLLGKHITKPQLTEKLLKKPPFRFLHDIVTGLVREHGFLKGLFTDSEMVSDNVKERDAKIAFLTKLITAVKSITGKDLQARPNKIIAGLEPIETNKLLQTIGNCLSDKIDTRQYVKSLKKGGKEGKDLGALKKVSSKGSVDQSDLTKKKEAMKRDKLRKNSMEVSPKEKKLGKSSKSKIADGSAVSTPESDDKSPKNKEPVPKKGSRKIKEDIVRTKLTEGIKETSKAIEPVKESPQEEPIEIKDSWTPQTMIEASVINQNKEVQEGPLLQTHQKAHARIEEEKLHQEKDIEIVRQASAKPKSARPRSGQNTLKYGRHQTMDKEVDEAQEENQGESKTSPAIRPRSSMLRPPSVRPSSARPGAPRLRPGSSIPMKELIPMGKIKVIVESCDSKGSADVNEDEEETVVIESAPEEVINPEHTLMEKCLDIPSDKGHLVEQILEQIQGSDGATITDRSPLEWENESMRNKDATVKEINALRASIQALTRTANPLGKLTSYLHEDIETMHKELETWRITRKQTMQEINRQKRLNNDSNQPLQLQLELLDENIKNQRDEISAVKYNIIKNDERIRQLINKQITIE